MLKGVTIRELNILQEILPKENKNLGAVLYSALQGVSKEELFNMTEEQFIVKVRIAQKRETN